MYLASNPYLPKYKVRVSVLLKDGEVYDGHVFISGGQRISDLLRNPTTFLAFETLDGAFHLFNIKSVMRVIPKEDETTHEGLGQTRPPSSSSGFFRASTAEADAAERDAVMQGFLDDGAVGSGPEPPPAADPLFSAPAPARRPAFRLGQLSLAAVSAASRGIEGFHARPGRRRLRSVGSRNAGRYTAAALILLLGLALGLAATPLLIAEPTAEKRQADYGEALRAYTRGDYDAAAPAFEELASQGMVEAQYRLGVMYSQGEGVPRDHAEALAWHRRAAEHGHAQAQTALGIMYRNGLGVRQDYKTAYVWFGLGAAGGDGRAVSMGQEVAQRMSYEEVAEAERRIQDWRSRNGAAR